MNCQNVSEFTLHEGMSGSDFGDVREKKMYHKIVKQNPRPINMLIHKNAQEVNKILPENSI